MEQSNAFPVLNWLPQITGLNSIEHLWNVVEKETRIVIAQLSNLEEMGDAMMKKWTRISEKCFQNIVESMPRGTFFKDKNDTKRHKI